MSANRSKVIFLDIDGVLNCQSTIANNVDLSNHMCNLLDYLIDETKATVVISSAWRVLHTLPEIRTLLRRSGVIHCSEEYIVGMTRRSKGDECRGQQIEDWIADHREISRYVIIDDDSDFFQYQLPYHVHTSNAVGFTWRGFKQARDILNSVVAPQEMEAPTSQVPQEPTSPPEPKTFPEIDAVLNVFVETPVAPVTRVMNAIATATDWCSFDDKSPDEGYVVKLLVRKKEATNGSNGVIASKLATTSTELEEVCDQLTARAQAHATLNNVPVRMYITINRRQMRKALALLIRRLTNIMFQMTGKDDGGAINRMKKLGAAWYSCLESTEARAGRGTWLVDVDDIDEPMGVIGSFEKAGLSPKRVYPTPNGWAFLVHPFNERSLPSHLNYTIKKDELLFLQKWDPK